MDVSDSLVPIFIKTEVPKGVKQIGTGVFLEFQSLPFLFTSAHVTDDLSKGKLLIPTAHGLSEINGYLSHIDLLPETSRKDDSVDMAYYKLNSLFASQLCMYFKPLQNNIDILPSALELSAVSVVGFPASKAKKKGNTFSSELLYYRGIAADKDIYEKYKLSPEHNIIIQFNKKNTVSPKDGKHYMPPSPRGVSGGAIFAWPTGKEISQDWSLPKLVGIFHSYKEKEGLLIGTTLISYVAATTLGQMKRYGGVL